MKGARFGLYLAVVGMRGGVGGSGDRGGPTRYRRALVQRRSSDRGPGQYDEVVRKDDLLT